MTEHSSPDSEPDQDGIDFALGQLCAFLGVDPEAVNWDAATETIDGDVQAVIGNILRAKFGEDWGPSDVAQRDDPPFPTLPLRGGSRLPSVNRDNAQAAGKKIPDCGDLKDFVNILRVWPAHEGHDALAAHYVSELMNDAADFLEALAGRATADSEQAAREMQRAVLTDAMIEAAWHAYQSTGIDLLADSDEETKKCMVEGLKAALGASTQPQAETGTGDLVNRLLAAPVTLKTGREAAAVIAELEAENKRLRAEPQAAVLTDLQCWKDGRLVACDLPDFIRSLRRYSGWADEQFGTRSDAAAHLGERLSAAIGAIAALSRPTLPQAAWQPIETAPKEGGSFLVWVPENKCIFAVTLDSAGVLRIFGGGYRDHLKGATHWCPLPDSPLSRPQCQTCGGRREVGGFVSAESGYQTDPCPDCSAHPSQKQE